MSIFARIATVHPAIVSAACFGAFATSIYWLQATSAFAIVFWLTIAVLFYGWTLAVYITLREATSPHSRGRHPLFPSVVFVSVLLAHLGSALLASPPEYSPSLASTALGLAFAVAMLTWAWIIGDAMVTAEATKLEIANPQPASAIVFQILLLPIGIWFLQPRISRLAAKD